MNRPTEAIVALSEAKGLTFDCETIPFAALRATKRCGMALVSILAVVSLIALLTVATLAVSARLEQGSSLALRDASLDAAASFALTTAVVQWRQQSFSTLTIGSSRELDVQVPGSPISASVTVTRLGAELYWAVAEAAARDGSRRRENLVLRLVVPNADSIPALHVAGDVVLSQQFTIDRDTAPGCTPAAPDLMIAPNASLSSASGPLPTMTVERNPSATDSAFLLKIGNVSISSLVSTADLTLAAGSAVSTPSGVVHATGDLIITSGSGQGILIVEGLLTLAGPVAFTGVIVARGGIVALAAGVQVTGVIRTGPAPSAGAASASFSQQFVLRTSACAVQSTVIAAVMPRPVAGRRWAEMF